MKFGNIDYKKLEEILGRPDWYLELHEELKYFVYDYKQIYNLLNSEEERKDLKLKRNDLLIYFSEMLSNGKVALGRNNEYFFDEERKPIDTIVIHHTSRPTETSLELIEALQLVNVYAREFSNPKRTYYGKGIFSGHIRDGKMTFLAYHYLVFPDGKVIKLLKDEYVGWHCGDWDYNCRSIAICFHADLEDDEPTEKALETANQIIAKYNPKQILGHREISNKTSCPGNKFLGENGWKKRIMQ